MDDLGSQSLFERAFGAEGLLEVFTEEMVDAGVFRTHEAGGGVDSEGDGVAEARDLPSLVRGPV
jgi:hypothetical protein